MKTIKDKIVLVTGANRGIGKALVQASLKKEAKKVYATCRDLSKMPNFGDKRVIPLELDITNNKQVIEVASRANDAQILINNAGVLNEGTILDGEWDRIKTDMNVNYFGTVGMMREFTDVLQRNAPSKIVNITSIVAYSPLPSIAGYSASKAALLSATYAARIELAKKGVMVHAVNPGAIDTEMNKGIDWDMPSPYSVAKTILDSVENGELDIIPEKIGLGMFNAWKEEPSKLAKMFYNMYHGENPAINYL